MGALNFVQLLGVVHTTNQGVYLEVGVLNQLFGIFTNLNRQLTSRCQNQCPSFANIALVFDGVFQQIADNTDQKGRSFTCACLCLANHVMAAQRMGQRSTLNRCSVGKASSLNAAQQRQWQIEVVEASFALLHFDNELIDTPGLFGAVIGPATAASTTSGTSYR